MNKSRKVNSSTWTSNVFVKVGERNWCPPPFQLSMAFSEFYIFHFLGCTHENIKFQGWVSMLHVRVLFKVFHEIGLALTNSLYLLSCTFENDLHSMLVLHTDAIFIVLLKMHLVTWLISLTALLIIICYFKFKVNCCNECNLF